jgi:hypothetical protein
MLLYEADIDGNYQLVGAEESEQTIPTPEPTGAYNDNEPFLISIAVT